MSSSSSKLDLCSCLRYLTGLQNISTFAQQTPAISANLKAHPVPCPAMAGTTCTLPGCSKPHPTILGLGQPQLLWVTKKTTKKPYLFEKLEDFPPLFGLWVPSFPFLEKSHGVSSTWIFTGRKKEWGMHGLLEVSSWFLKTSVEVWLFARWLILQLCIAVRVMYLTLYHTRHSVLLNPGRAHVSKPGEGPDMGERTKLLDRKKIILYLEYRSSIP